MSKIERYEEGIYQALKAANICTECRYRFAEPSSFLCFECREKARKRNRENYNKRKQDPEFMEKQRERKRKHYWYLKENGYCVKCGKKEQYRQHICKQCYTKQKIRYENNKWKHNKN